MLQIERMAQGSADREIGVPGGLRAARLSETAGNRASHAERVAISRNDHAPRTQSRRESKPGYTSDKAGLLGVTQWPECRAGVFFNVHKAKRMAHTLDRVMGLTHKAEATEAGDQLTKFAKAIGAEWYVERKSGEPASSSYRDNNWNWFSVSTG
jgi:hypothetical protein